MNTLTNQTTNKRSQATEGKYGQLTDVPGKKVDKDQLNQSLVP